MKAECLRLAFRFFHAGLCTLMVRKLSHLP